MKQKKLNEYGIIAKKANTREVKWNLKTDRLYKAKLMRYEDGMLELYEKL